MIKLKKRPVENSVNSPVTQVVERPENFEELDTEDCAISNLVIKARDIADNSNDYMVVKANPQNVRFNDHAGLTFVTESGDVHDYSISRFALGQLGTKIGVPARYLEKCVASGRIDLAQDNVNSWLEDYNKDLFIREHRGGIRGILSSKYSVCDSHDILDVVDDAVDLSKYKIKGSFLTPERLHVRLVSKDMLSIEGEDLFAGLFIDSSDVGRNVLTVRFGIYKQVCTNGLIVAKAGGVLFEQKHIGITAEEFHSGLTASLKNVDVLTENAVEWVNRAREKHNHWSSSSIYEDDINEFIGYIRQRTLLSEESSKKVINLMNTKYEDTTWGLVNGITEVAQDFTLEKRLELEKVAGDILLGRTA